MGALLFGLIVALAIAWWGSKPRRRMDMSHMGDPWGSPPMVMPVAPPDWKARIEAEMAAMAPIDDAPEPPLDDTAVYPSEAPTEELFPDWPMRSESERRYDP